MSHTRSFARREPLTFFADAMLGKLARWLRTLGYDTAYQSDILDADLVQQVLHENRWLLTRDGYLVQRKVLQGRSTLIRSDDVREQLGQLHVELGLSLLLNQSTPSRCAACNALLESLPPEKATALVPPVVAKQYQDFVRCPHCHRLYWPGTHWLHLQQQLTALRARAIR
ncbi:MAG: hypothetical protein D6704_00155 [Nitrospirae bacterium]|nr:MAG: hypothetical protein D6704_00155 [Nitrospirota bacterium]